VYHTFDTPSFYLNTCLDAGSVLSNLAL